MSMSTNQKKFLQKERRNKIFVILMQILIVVIFLISWEVLANKKILNPFIFSSPSRIILTIKNLFLEGSLITHILTTLYEIVLAFFIGIASGFLIAILLYEVKTLAKILDPFLTMLNSLPKVALGPIIIIWAGANTKAIIVMALLINLIVSIVNIYNGFLGTDEIKIKLLQSFGATKGQILRYLVIPGSKRTIISSLKLNISMTLIGVIMGEFLVSKKGIGYLIIYGTQVFNLNVVMAGIVILIILSFIIYEGVSLLEKRLLQEKN